jgi:hypothetical protein
MADGAVVRVRQLLIRAAREFMEGKTPSMAHHPDLNYRNIHSIGAVIPADADWHTLVD